MKLFETAKFQKLRKKLRSDAEKQALKRAVLSISESPFDGKKLKGAFKDLRSLRYFAEEQERRLVYQVRGDEILLLWFGPRERIYD